MDRSAEASPARVGLIRVATSLWGGSEARHFFPAREIDFRDGVVQPIDYQGNHYFFSHTAVAGDHQTHDPSELYVFTKQGTE